MSETPQQESFSAAVRNWVQVVAFLLAGVWGVYTFVYSEIVAPSSAPVNVSTELQIEDVGEIVDASNRRLRAVQLTITAVNPSSREVYILPNFWVAYGLNVGPAPDSAAWAQALTSSVNRRELLHGGRHFQVEGGDMVAANLAFPDDALKPNERIVRTMMFYVPADAYDLIQVETVMPTAHTKGLADMSYEIDGAQISWSVFEIGAGGARTEITDDEARMAALSARAGLQLSTSLRQAPLARRRAPN